MYIYSSDNDIQLYMHPERFLILDKNNGKTGEDLNGKEIFFCTLTEKFISSFGIESRSKDLNLVNWHTEIRDIIRLAPVFPDNFVFQRTGRVVGTLLAIERKTGQVFGKLKVMWLAI